METAERENKKKYLHACLYEPRNFTTLFASVYVLLGVEAEATLKRISSRLATMWKEPYSCTYG